MEMKSHSLLKMGLNNDVDNCYRSLNGVNKRRKLAIIENPENGSQFRMSHSHVIKQKYRVFKKFERTTLFLFLELS
jgi:hypothetical protein